MRKTTNISFMCLSHQNRKGSALVIVLLLVAMITALVVEFAYEIYTDTSSVANWVDSQRASLIAKSGQTFSSEFLKEVDGYDYTHTKEITLPVPLDFGPDSSLILKVEDENSKLNINRVNETFYFETLKRMLQYLNINPNLADSIADWIDADSEPEGPGGYEDKVKNAPLKSVGELRHIKGMDTETFNKLSPFITIYGNGKININTASLTVLMNLHNDMTETLAKNIISYREAAPFDDAAFLQNVSGMETIGPLIGGYTSAKSDNFRIYSIAKSHEITRIIESVMDTSLIVHYWREGQ